MPLHQLKSEVELNYTNSNVFIESHMSTEPDTHIDQSGSESSLKRQSLYTSVFTAWRRSTSQRTARWHPTLAADTYDLLTRMPI